MRGLLIAALFVVAPDITFAAEEIKWPDNSILVPHFADAFIGAECLDYAGTTDEDIDACVAGERAGYRATVMMLSDPEIGEKAAARYRACAAGLGMHGGRFYRRRAECIGGSFLYKWRFETTRRASLTEPEPAIKTATEEPPPASPNDDPLILTKRATQDRPGDGYSSASFD